MVPRVWTRNIAANGTWECTAGRDLDHTPMDPRAHPTNKHVSYRVCYGDRCLPKRPTTAPDFPAVLWRKSTRCTGK